MTGKDENFLEMQMLNETGLVSYGHRTWNSAAHLTDQHAEVQRDKAISSRSHG